MEKYEPNNSATPKGAPRPAPKPVHDNPPDMSQWQMRSQHLLQPLCRWWVTSRVLTDAEVREMAVGTCV